MTFSDGTFMGAKTQDTTSLPCFARAIAAELARMYPHHTAKHVSQDLGCSPKAAANLLDLHLSKATVGRLIVAYGPGWVAERVLEAAGSSLSEYIRSQAEEARVEASRHERRADELAKLETAIRATRRARTAGDLGVGA